MGRNGIGMYFTEVDEIYEFLMGLSNKNVVERYDNKDILICFNKWNLTTSLLDFFPSLIDLFPSIILNKTINFQHLHLKIFI